MPTLSRPRCAKSCFELLLRLPQILVMSMAVSWCIIRVDGARYAVDDANRSENPNTRTEMIGICPNRHRRCRARYEREASGFWYSGLG